MIEVLGNKNVYMRITFLPYETVSLHLNIFSLSIKSIHFNIEFVFTHF